jgi:secreted PhoX family phosphatase
MEDGRLWIFVDGSKELAAFEKSGELAKHVVIPRSGPNGMTVKAPDRDVVLEYMCAKPGFIAMAMDGRVWIFEDGSKEYEQFRSHGELAKHIVRPAAGPMRSTLRAPDAATLDAWAFSKPGFVTIVEDGRLWIFRDGSKELADFQKHGELAKHIVRPGAGPNRMTVKAPDAATADAYLAMAN